jgi:hypothetical protein
MTLCVAFRATDGMVALCDGMTSYGVPKGQHSPPPARLNTRKLCLGPENQSWVLMCANRNKYKDGSAAIDVAEDLIASLPQECENAASLEPVARYIWDHFTKLEVHHRPGPEAIPDVWSNGSEVERRLEGLLVGYAPAGDGEAEFWTMMADGYPPNRCDDDFVGIGSGVDPARQLLTDIRGFDRWYRDAMAQHGCSESVCELDTGRAELAALKGLQLGLTHEHGALAHLDHIVGGNWRSARIFPGQHPLQRCHQSGKTTGT